MVDFARETLEDSFLAVPHFDAAESFRAGSTLRAAVTGERVALLPWSPRFGELGPHLPPSLAPRMMPQETPETVRNAQKIPLNIYRLRFMNFPFSFKNLSPFSLM